MDSRNALSRASLYAKNHKMVFVLYIIGNAGRSKGLIWSFGPVPIGTGNYLHMPIDRLMISSPWVPSLAGV